VARAGQRIIEDQVGLRCRADDNPPPRREPEPLPGRDDFQPQGGEVDAPVTP
jgi:hypothetical protein